MIYLINGLPFTLQQEKNVYLDVGSGALAGRPSLFSPSLNSETRVCSWRSCHLDLLQLRQALSLWLRLDS
jgi:hypothetical protein